MNVSILSRGAHRRLILVALTAGSALAGGPALAATQGSQGATSTGTVGISASVPSRVRISGLDDVAFTNQDPSADASSAQNVCVWSNTATKGYSITATGDGGGPFELVNGAEAVAYTVQWADSADQSTGAALVSGTAVTGLNSTATSHSCTGGSSETASLVVGLASADLGTMQAGLSYTGTLTLVVAPE